MTLSSEANELGRALVELMNGPINGRIEPTQRQVHAAAQALCFEKHHDWRYDPGNPKHDKWRARARAALRAANGVRP